MTAYEFHPDVAKVATAVRANPKLFGYNRPEDAGDSLFRAVLAIENVKHLDNTLKGKAAEFAKATEALRSAHELLGVFPGDRRWFEKVCEAALQALYIGNRLICESESKDEKVLKYSALFLTYCFDFKELRDARTSTLN